MRCHDLRRVLEQGLAPRYECREEDGRLTIVTPAEHPDGDLVELYLTEEDGRLVLTDHAETLAVLASYGLELG